MKLYIQDFEQHRKLSENAFTIDPEMLKFKAVHLFIASHNWEQIEIHLSNRVDPEDIKYLHLVSDNIKTIIPKDSKQDVLRCLCNIYPDKAGSLRQAYMCNSSLDRVVTSIEFSN